MVGESIAASVATDRALTVRMVGAFSVESPAGVLTAAEVGSYKARSLLALLAVERGRLVPVDRIIDILWGDEPPVRAARNVATLVSRLRTVLGGQVVVGGPTGYRLGGGVAVDLYGAAKLVRTAELATAGGEPARGLRTAHAALDVLDRGAVLDEYPQADWAEAARAVHLTLLRRSRHAVAEAALRVGDLDGALVAAEAALHADPLDEVACRALMRVHASAGEPARALSVYQRLREVFRAELGLDPSAATRDVHVAILRGGLVDSSGTTPDPRPAAPARAASVDAEVEIFVGRERDLSLLRAAWARAANGDSGLVVVTGEAGIGKSRLVTELAREIPTGGGLVAQVRCYRPARSLFLHPVAEMLTHIASRLPPDVVGNSLDDHVGRLAALSPELAAVLKAPPGEAADAVGPRAHAYHAVAVFLRRLSATRPLLLIFDDLHNADVATVEVLHYFARLPNAGRLLIVATVRTEESEAVLDAIGELTCVLEVGPLDTAAIRRLATIVGHPASAEDVERCTGGHTLFVAEMLRAVSAGRTGTPERVRRLVLHRMRGIGQQSQDVLRAAAVIGRAFAPGDIARLLDITVAEAARRCERILPTRLVAPAGDRYRFANDLTRQVLYDTTPQPTRRAYE